MNPYLKRHLSQFERGRKSEKVVAKKIGATLTPASGSSRSKGDMQKNRWLLEAKSTVKNTFGLSFAVLSKIDQEALMQGLKPALSLRFVGPTGRPVIGGSWVLIKEDQFTESFVDE